MKEKVEIVRYKDNQWEKREDVVTSEVPLTIFLDGEQLLTLLCTPDKMDCLAVGFLFSEGFINSREDIEFIDLSIKTTTIRIKIKDQKKIDKRDIFSKRIITSGCGKGMTFFDYRDFSQCEKITSGIRVPADRILQLMNEFQKRSELFLETGGVHSAALSDGEQLLLFAEDLGRHNALDKIFGEALWNGMDLLDKIILTSGRLSSEIAIKVLKRGCPILVSPSAPTDLAISIAKQMGLTMVGFARGKRLNLYSMPERILM